MPSQPSVPKFAGTAGLPGISQKLMESAQVYSDKVPTAPVQPAHIGSAVAQVATWAVVEHALKSEQ